MRTDIALLCVLTLLSSLALADDTQHMHDHADTIFHVFTLQADTGRGEHDAVSSWDFDGWVGGDDNKLWLKSKGEVVSGTTEHAEVWAMVSRNIATFWDAQAGMRYDTDPATTTYGVIGFTGLAPYSFKTEAHLFISDDGDISARLHEENDFLITQQWIIKPHAELNWSAKDVPKQEIASGFTSAEAGVQLRYAITRKFAPYIDIRYVHLFGNTATIATRNDKDKDDVIVSIGIQWMF